MDTTLFIVLLVAVILAAFWLRGRLAFHHRPRFEVLVYLSIHSRETEDVLGTNLPSSMSHLYKTISLKSLPSPGIELDGLGAGPLEIARVVIEDGAKHDAFLQLAPVAVAAEEIDSFAASLVADLGWKPLKMAPPYPAGGA